MNRSLRLIPGVFALVLFTRADQAGNTRRDPEPDQDVTAPICYTNQLLVLSGRDGVAAVLLSARTKEQIDYLFRFLPKSEKKEVLGNGSVFEKYRRVPGADPSDSILVDEGGQLHVKAGPIAVRWSQCDRNWGWVYYKPESVRVHIARAEDFDKLDLQRFMEKPQR
ncbi:MAG: hypothetical protein FJ291_27090 [Planctomycetes bacterium]|nr:hypothetical protein [Planctomycetota bacterium]